MRSQESLLEEIRVAREAIAKEFDYDIERLGHAMQERQAKNGRRVVRLSPKRIPFEKKAG